MIIMKQRDISQMNIWHEFDNFMAERGYHVHSHNDHNMGRGSVAYKDDRFAPIFNLHVWGGETAKHFVSIHITDRNGYAILEGPTAAIYSMSDTGDSEKNALVFSRMLNDAYEKYGGYSKANRLDFAFNEMKEDRRVYDENCLALEAESGDKNAHAQNNIAPNEDVPVVTTIYFTTTEGPDATQFDTQDVCELLELFHGLLVESNLKLISVDGVDHDIDRVTLSHSSVDELINGATAASEKMSGSDKIADKGIEKE